MADRTVKHEITAEYSQAVEGYRRVRTEMATADRQAAEMNRRTKESKQAVQDLRNEAGLLGNEFKSWVQGAAIIGTVTAAMDKLFSATKEVRAAMAESGKGMREYLMGESGGRVGLQLKAREAAAMGKQYGLKSGDAGRIFDWASDVSRGDKEKTIPLAREAMKLEQMGVSRDDIQATLANLVRQGYSAEQGGAILAGGMDELHVSGRTAAKIVARGADLGSAGNAIAIAKVLQATGGLTDKELGGSLGSIADAMTTGKIGQIMERKYAAAGMDMSKVSMQQRLADIAGIYGTDENRLKKRFGLSDDAAKGLSALLTSREQLATEQYNIARIPVGYTEKKLATLRDTPALKELYAQEDAAAATDYERTFGRLSKRTRESGELERRAAARYEQSPIARALFTDGTGETNFLGSMARRFETNPYIGAIGGWGATAGARAALGVQGPGLGEVGISNGMSEKSASDLVDALKENTKATRENSGAGGVDSYSAAKRVNRNAGVN